jgi:hypothetical protein
MRIAVTGGTGELETMAAQFRRWNPQFKMIGLRFSATSLSTAGGRRLKPYGRLPIAV